MSSMSIGVICGVLVGVVLVAFILKATKTDGTMKCKYDERQQIVRGKGFKYGFFTLMIYNFLYAAVESSMERRYMDTWTAMILGIAAGVLVYVSYCIWNEGYFSLNESPKRVMIAFVLIAAINLVLGGIQIRRGGVIVDGVLTAQCMNLICGGMFLIVFAVLFAKRIRNKREAE